ncbi:hypothetical protein DAPPUDRAFT_110964 [Daphnia pulex]|uniref:Uncharacterized protein n=1 Tax=Daphnia pulex TaxID=6669 RepID=E9H7Q7_DAPPU|nr:hypothetical protein DAPPUDRAFT_110964 [Daphnia pulex]|eukprot:EFX72223.1 hypothetical protein DAPPUDRAFT_110964 [Daphnia pulex]
MFFVLLIIGASSQTTGGNNITVCDCGRAEVIGLMDINLPSYCNDKITSTQSVMEAYEFYVTEEPHTMWSADLCMTWRKTRTTTGYCFGSFDTIDTMVTSVTTADECRQLVKSHVCDGNKMTELNENAYEFKGNPTQKGTWMQEVIETKKNCATKKILLHRDCLTCPVMSPFGVLTNKTDETAVVSRDITIIWETPTLQKDEKCKLKKVTSATGTTSKQDDGSFKLIDEINQLEFHYDGKTYDEFCNHTYHKLANLKNAYIELHKLAKKEGMLLFNRQHGMCLSFQTLELDQCRPVEEQWYKISQTLVVQSFKDPSSCMGFVNHELQRTNKRCDMQKMPHEGELTRKDYRPKIIPLVWNPQTKALTDGVYCLEAYKDKRVEAIKHQKELTEFALRLQSHQLVSPAVSDLNSPNAYAAPHSCNQIARYNQTSRSAESRYIKKTAYTLERFSKKAAAHQPTNRHCTRKELAKMMRRDPAEERAEGEELHRPGYNLRPCSRTTSKKPAQEIQDSPDSPEGPLSGVHVQPITMKRRSGYTTNKEIEDLLKEQENWELTESSPVVTVSHDRPQSRRGEEDRQEEDYDPESRTLPSYLKQLRRILLRLREAATAARRNLDQIRRLAYDGDIVENGIQQLVGEQEMDTEDDE